MNMEAKHQASFQTATLDDVRQMITWANQEGWNLGLDDAEAFWQADKTGFFVARVKSEMVAAISVVNHDRHMAFLGLYLCHPQFRGQGIGFGLWRHALTHAGSRCVGLDGVAEQEENYAKSGFVRQGAITRLQGTLQSTTLGDTRFVNMPLDLDRVAELDMHAIGYERLKFLYHWICDDVLSRKTIVAEKDGTVTGFATARQCFEGVKIGPIIAQSNTDAMMLLTAAASLFNTEKIIVDLPGTQNEFIKMLCARGFETTFETAHMFCGKAPKTSKNYRAVASMECG
jgi:GNAT superfamily N-acetyltransferase